MIAGDALDQLRWAIARRVTKVHIPDLVHWQQYDEGRRFCAVCQLFYDFGEHLAGSHEHGQMPDPRIPRYSTDATAAMLVAEAMRAHPLAMFRTLRLVAYPYNRTYATFDRDADDSDWTEANGEHATPEAICRAALAVVDATGWPE